MYETKENLWLVECFSGIKRYFALKKCFFSFLNCSISDPKKKWLMQVVEQALSLLMLIFCLSVLGFCAFGLELCLLLGGINVLSLSLKEKVATHLVLVRDLRWKVGNLNFSSVFNFFVVITVLGCIARSIVHFFFCFLLEGD